MNYSLEEFGWDDGFQQELDRMDREDLFPARLIRENRGEYVVSTGDYEKRAVLAGAFRFANGSDDSLPTIGDWVGVEAKENSEELVIRNLLERRSLIKRQMAGEESKWQLIAANVDFLFLVCGLDEDYNVRRIQRALTLAWSSGAQPVIVLNKADLCEDLEDKIDEVRAIGRGAPVHALSAIEPAGTKVLEEYFGNGKSVAMIGSSGVGKSTLLNAFMGFARMATQANRDGDSRGRHTTTWRELVILPRGGVLIDLPGMRELQLTGEKAGLERTFEDIEDLARKCRFRDCRHEGEPGCAVEAALASGELGRERFHQYLKLRREGAAARSRRAERIRREGVGKQKRAGKEAFLKEIGARKRKDARAKRRSGIDWD